MSLPLALIFGDKGIPVKNENFILIKIRRSSASYQTILDIQRLMPHSMLLYCDAMKPIMIGDVFGKVLKLIPIEHASSKNTSILYESHHLDFTPVNSNQLSTFHFQLRIANGHLIEFAHKNIHVLVNILFRQKQK